MPASLYLLDTNIVVAYARGKGVVFDLVEARYSLSSKLAACVVSVITVAEIEALFRKWNWAGPRITRARTALVDKLLAIDIVRVDTALMAAYAEIDHASNANPAGARVMHKNDLWIAATARTLNATLVTSDQDFDHLHPTLLTRHYVDQAQRTIII